MTFLHKYSKRTRMILLVAAILLAYGYLVRLLNIYFIWEASTWGWFILFVGLFSFLLENIKFRKSLNNKTIFQKIALGITGLIISVRIIFIFLVPRTDAYLAAEKFLLNDSTVVQMVGQVKGFALQQRGSVSVHNDSKGDIGEAQLFITVKGNKMYRDFALHLNKDYERPWLVDTLW